MEAYELAVRCTDDGAPKFSGRYCRASYAYSSLSTRNLHRADSFPSNAQNHAKKRARRDLPVRARAYLGRRFYFILFYLFFSCIRFRKAVPPAARLNGQAKVRLAVDCSLNRSFAKTGCTNLARMDGTVPEAGPRWIGSILRRSGNLSSEVYERTCCTSGVRCQISVALAPPDNSRI